MASQYKTKDGDVLDQICYEQYGTSEALVTVLEANPFLADEGTYLAAGITILLPDFTPSVVESEDTLWS